MESNYKITVSIIIPVLNEEANLPILLQSIKTQYLPETVELSDIVVVDNGSADNSVCVSRKYCTKVIVRPNDSIADLRNMGAIESSGEIYVFMDADCALAEDVIHNVTLLMGETMIAAVGPDALIPMDSSTWVQTAWYFHTKQMKVGESTTEVDALASGFIAIKAEYFKAINGFNGTLDIGEDTDISRRLRALGLKLIKSSLLHVYNSGHPRTLFQLVKREYWHGDSITHLLTHKNIDRLTIYFMINSIMQLLLVLSVYYRAYILIVIIAGMLTVPSIIKAIKKTRNMSQLTLQLIIIYLIYINTRSIALYNIKTR